MFPAKLTLDFTTVTGNYFVVAEMELVVLSLQITAPFPDLPKHILEIKESIFNVQGAVPCGTKQLIFLTGLWQSMHVRLDRNTKKLSSVPIIVTHFNIKQCALL